MKYIILSLLVVITACDTPTRSRFPNSTVAGNNSSAPGTGFDLGGGTTVPTTGTPVPTSPGFESCNLTKSHSTADLGSLGICRHSSDETQVRFVTSLTNSSSRTCLIPTYKDSTGSSIYLGDPQCTYTEAEKIYTGKLHKNRQGLSQLPINGVMIMREGLLVEYYACMDSYQKWIQYYCPANPNYAPCVQNASNYRSTICTQFKTKYPNNYLDINLR